MNHITVAFIALLLLAGAAFGAEVMLRLPARPEGAPTGLEFAREIQGLDLSAREQAVTAQMLAGNVPEFLRHLKPVQIGEIRNGHTNTAIIHVTPDYLAIGSDKDYLLFPLSPGTAQHIADVLECSLPTRKIVDAIYTAADVKLAPTPIPPSDAMTTVPVFAHHNNLVRAQRAESLVQHPLGALVAGHKKDVVLSPLLASLPEKVAIYGWHQTNGSPIQPLYLGHSISWVDYSQCIRLVHRTMSLNGAATTVAEVLTHPALAGVLSDEGIFQSPRYPANLASNATATTAVFPPAAHFQTNNQFHEQTASFIFAPEVRIRINAPAQMPTSKSDTLELIIYALPNGNTIEQTVGKIPQPGDDWHFEIQHIGAQTRFLRKQLPGQSLAVAYLETTMKSWPVWRTKHGDQLIPSIVETIKGAFPDRQMNVVLTGHSGGGSFTFGYLNGMAKIPDDVTRIAFLDSNYAYDPDQGHTDKLVRWLKSSDRHFLCVFAYDDARALLNGKPFVSATGGTWGRSHAMQLDLANYFPFAVAKDAEFQKFSALDGRVRFILKENPDRKILHTVQVERNGFIHALLLGTPQEDQGYQYFGDRAYSRWIAP